MTYELKYIAPIKTNSANVQAEFYYQCKIRGIVCILEHKHDGNRFDCVIVKGGIITHIIEIKNTIRPRKTPKPLKQIKRYEQYRTPVILVRGKAEVLPVVIAIKEGRL